jgi:hypothetical protein
MKMTLEINGNTSIECDQEGLVHIIQNGNLASPGGSIWIDSKELLKGLLKVMPMGDAYAAYAPPAPGEPLPSNLGYPGPQNNR